MRYTLDELIEWLVRVRGGDAGDLFKDVRGHTPVVVNGDTRVHLEAALTYTGDGPATVEPGTKASPEECWETCLHIETEGG